MADALCRIEAEDGKTEIDMARQLRPDCILLHLSSKINPGLKSRHARGRGRHIGYTGDYDSSDDISNIVVEAALSFGASHSSYTRLIRGKFDAAALDAAIRESVAKPMNW